MIRFRLLILVILLMCIFCSCKRNNSLDRDIMNEVDYFAYPIDNISLGFDVDDSGYLYYIQKENSNKVHEYKDINGEPIELERYDYRLNIVDQTGNNLNSYILSERPVYGVKVYNGNVIFYTMAVSNKSDKDLEKGINENKHGDEITYTEKNSEFVFHEFNLDTQETKEIARIYGISSIISYEVINEQIYILGMDRDNMTKEYSLSEFVDYYFYSGEVICKFDISKGICEILEVEFPLSFAKTLDNNLLIYAYDEEDGYYFNMYYTEDYSLAKRTFNDLGMMRCFDIYNKDNDFIYNSHSTGILCLVSSSIDSNKGFKEIMPNVSVGSIVCQGEYTYYNNIKNSYKIERIKNATYMKENNIINMISSETAPYMPFGCGYTFGVEYVDAEKFALSVLSQDNEYDIYLMSSRQSVSENIRSKGSFYQLDDVEGVKDYLDACFPYIKETAITNEGDIWMFPISVDIPCFIYNEATCRENGIDFTSQTDIETFISSLSAIPDNQLISDSYFISLYMLNENIFYQYLNTYDDFETKYFRSIAPIMKEKVNYIKDNSILGNVYINEMLRLGELQNILFYMGYDYNTQSKNYSKNNLRVSGVPKIENQESEIASCLYLCVNPSSNNLESTLNYISSLCKYLLNNNNAMMFKDRNLYPQGQQIDDLYNVYSNGKIVYTLSDDLYVNDYIKYLEDDIDLDTFINEANRKMDTFKNE